MLQMDILMSMTKRLVDIDDNLLAEATAVLDARTMKEAVNGALREVVRASLRRRHAARLATMDGLDLDDPDIRDRAWRR